MKIGHKLVLKRNCFQDLVAIATEGGAQKLTKSFISRRVMAVVIMNKNYK
jgi:hypothetical protein